MFVPVPASRRHDGQLWLTALGLSLLANFALLLGLGFLAIKTHKIKQQQVSAPPPAAENFLTIFPSFASSALVPAAEPAAKRFARTSADQTAEKPEKPVFQGERNTQATSDRAPDSSAPPLPSQAGRKPFNSDDFETTESDYRDGQLTTEPSASSSASPSSGAESVMAAASETQQKTGTADTLAMPAPREKLLEGPNPVDIPVPKPAEIAEAPKGEKPSLPKPAEKPTKPEEAPKPKRAIADPAFSGFQRKAAIQGSISRTGRSSLNVEDSPLGRYQASISRAVEQEWQRNCVRHRDFITPGFLTVRFFVETSGRVKTVQFVGEMETGEVQKGFTLNAIRDAEIPAMPAALKKEYVKEPLELIFNFYF